MASDSSDIPAGYFSTFSIADANGLVPEDQKVAQKRNRRVFVCLPCHKRKLKCDKVQPCGRCIAAGTPDTCVYQPVSSSPRASTSTSTPAPSTSRDAKKEARRRSSHIQKEKKKEKGKEKETEKPKTISPVTPLSEQSCALDSSPESMAVEESNHSSTAPTSVGCGEGQSPTNPNSVQSTLAHSKDASGSAGTGPEPTPYSWILPGIKLSIHSYKEMYTRSNALDENSMRAVPFLFGTNLAWQSRYRQIKSLKCLFSSIKDNVNFPFASTDSPSPTKMQILGGFPSNTIVDALVANYLESYETTHCLFEPMQLDRELAVFRQTPQDVSDEWLAQLCMILALGATTASDLAFASTGPSALEWTAFFLSGAQASLGRTPFMVMPSLAIVRTLCMMAVAKMAEVSSSGGSCSNHSSRGGYAPLVSFVTFVSHMAATLHLDSPQMLESSNSQRPMPSQTRVRMTVRLLELEVAILTGTLPCHDYCENDGNGEDGGSCEDEAQCQMETDVDNNNINSMPLFLHRWSNASLESTNSDDSITANLSNMGIYPVPAPSPTPPTPSIYESQPPFPAPKSVCPYRSTLSRLLPLLAKVINAANAPKPDLGRHQIEAWDTEILQCLQTAKTTLTQQHPSKGQKQWLQDTPKLRRQFRQYQFLGALGHRTLLALHHSSFCLSLSTTTSEYKQSYYSVIRSAMSLLGIQKNWARSSANLTSADLGNACPNNLGDLQWPLPSPQSSAGMLFGEKPIHPVGHGYGWLLDLCHSDFGAALMYIVLVLRMARQKGGGGGGGGGRGDSIEFSEGVVGCTEAALMAAARSSYQTMRDRSFRSAAHFNEFVGIAILFACFRGLQVEGMLPHVIDATNDVEQVVMAGRQHMLWAADNFMTQTSVLGLDGPFFVYGGM